MVVLPRREMDLLERLRELVAFRELLWALVLRELKVKYKNSILGFFWSLLNPALTMLVFTFIFSFVFRAGVRHFPLFFLSGLLPWNFFAMSLNRSTSSMIENADLIKKVYFPREVVPCAVLVTNLINLVLETVVLAVFLLAWRYWFFSYLPVLLFGFAVLMLFTGGIALVVSAATVFFRDLQQLVPLGVMVWFYGTAVIYPLDMVPASLRSLLTYLNPMNPIVSLFRDSLYWLRWPSWQTVVYSLVVSAAVWCIGFWIFGRVSPELPKEV